MNTWIDVMANCFPNCAQSPFVGDTWHKQSLSADTRLICIPKPSAEAYLTLERPQVCDASFSIGIKAIHDGV